MKKILYISAFQPSFKMEAGHKTTYHQLITLAKNYEIDLIIVQRTGPFVKELIYSELKSVHFIKLSFYDYPILLFISILKIIPVRYLSRFSLKLIFMLKKIDLTKYEFIQLDYTQVFWLTLILPKNTKIKLLCSDILTQFASRHNFFNKFFLGRFFYYEKLFFQRANEIILLCQKDLNIVESFFGIDSKKLSITPPAISHFVLDFKRDNSLVEEKTLLFWGSMSRPENYNAILNFINLIFIKLIKLDSKIKLYIVGSNPDKRLLKISKEYPSNILVTGFVDNPKQYFQRATLGIAPITSGAGIKVKVLEMLMCQIPVFSTIIGAEGIKKQKNLKVLPTIDCFYNEIIKFLNLESK
jgi:polysaccharide biosynthesis protein PslH